MKLLNADWLLGAFEALIVNRPSDPVANHFDGGVRTCIRVITESTTACDQAACLLRAPQQAEPVALTFPQIGRAHV